MSYSSKWPTDDERNAMWQPPTLPQLGDVRELVKRCVHKGWLGYPNGVRFDTNGYVIRRQPSLEIEQVTT